jgi:hypothetical protein
MELLRSDFKSVEDLDLEIGKRKMDPNVEKEAFIEHQEI